MLSSDWSSENTSIWTMTERKRVGEVASSSSASDADEEEGEMETLIIQNETNSTPKQRHLHSRFNNHQHFEIGDLNDRIRRKVWCSRKYCLILAVCVPTIAVLVYVYFSVDLTGIFRPPPTVSVDVPNERMLETELRSLFLLRNQQLGLLRLWNRTYGSSSGSRRVPLSPPPPASSQSSNFSSNSSINVGGKEKKTDVLSSPPVVSMEEFRSALLEQIKLNREIEKVLLSTHRGLNASSEGSDGDTNPLFSDLSVDICRKKENSLQKRTIEWKPKKNRYLFAICVSGQMSNHLICLQKHMLFAALLNRVLVLPSSKFDYQYDKIIDVNHINDCIGRKVVMPFDEFASLRKSKMQINRFICYSANPLCYVDEEHAKRLKALGISLPKFEAAWPEDAKSTEKKKRVAGDITSRFACEDEVLAVGDTFYADVEEEWMMQPGGPLSHKCKSVIQPSQLITLTAERFIQTFLGGNFIALHFRRHGFLKFCNEKKESCFFPIPQAAECILRVVEKSDAPVIYLSTDAAESETNLLQSLVVLNEKTVPLIRRPSHNSVEKWDALLYRNHLNGDNQVEAMLDKTICAMSSVFIGTFGSTFTDDIFRLRKDWGSASICDEYMCQGQQPNFIASSEQSST